MDKATSKEEFVKVMHWLSEHPKERNFLLNFTDPYTAQDYLRLMTSLEKDSMEYFIPLAIYNAFLNPEMDQAVKRLEADAIEFMWERMGPGRFLQNFRMLIEEEIRRPPSDEEEEFIIQKGETRP